MSARASTARVPLSRRSRLDSARHAGPESLKPPRRGKKSTKETAERDYERGKSGEGEHPSAKRSRARTRALKREPHSTASHRSLSAQARKASRQRGEASRKAAAAEAVRTKGKSGLRAAAKKAAKTRSRG